MRYHIKSGPTLLYPYLCSYPGIGIKQLYTYLAPLYSTTYALLCAGLENIALLCPPSPRRPALPFLIPFSFALPFYANPAECYTGRPGAAQLCSARFLSNPNLRLSFLVLFELALLNRTQLDSTRICCIQHLHPPLCICTCPGLYLYPCLHLYTNLIPLYLYLYLCLYIGFCLYFCLYLYLYIYFPLPPTSTTGSTSTCTYTSPSAFYSAPLDCTPLCSSLPALPWPTLLYYTLPTPPCPTLPEYALLYSSLLHPLRYTLFVFLLRLTLGNSRPLCPDLI